MIFNGKFTILPTSKILGKRGLEPNGKAQKFVDSQVLRYSDPLIPMQSGMLKKSGTLETVIGSGVVRYGTPYGRKNYYSNAGCGNQGLNRGGRRGRLWFERMKADHKADILRGVATLTGGKK